MKVRDVMTKDVLTIDEFTTVASAIKIMQDNSLSSLIIRPLEQQGSYGIVTEIDILNKVVGQGHNPHQLCVRDIMTRPCIEVNPDLQIKSVAKLFAQTGIFYAPIVQKKLFRPKKLLGVVSVRDLILRGEFVKQLSKPEELSSRKIEDSKTKKLSQLRDKDLTDYQRLRSQGAISANSTRILDKMPQNELEHLDHAIETELESPAYEINQVSEKADQETKNKKLFQLRDEDLTDYQRLRSQGSISRYSTRILDKMPQDELENVDNEIETELETPSDEIENSPEKDTKNARSKKLSNLRDRDLTDYQRLRSQGSISRYSTRIFDKMPQDKTDGKSDL